MGEVMFGNELFDHWLNQKSLEILGKVEKEKISTEDMLILSLKAQTNHFHHMDQEFRGEFKKITQSFEDIGKQFVNINQQFVRIDKQFDIIEEKFDKIEERFVKIDEKFDKIDEKFDKIDEKFDKIDEKFDKIEDKFDKKFDRLATVMMWQGGILATLISGIYFKLFLH